MRLKGINDSIKRSFKSVLALLIMAGALTVEAQTVQTIYSFDYANGAHPLAGLTLGSDGNCYGTTGGIMGGSAGSSATVFQVTTNGTLTMLVYFNSYTNGADVSAELTLGSDGKFYGTASSMGSYGYGTVFQVTTNGTLTTLVSFDGTNGAQPYAGLTLGSDGDFYGTTTLGGAYTNQWGQGYGTVFRVTTNGTLTTLVSFNVTNGTQPRAELTLGSDGNFYGTTAYGGSNDQGTVYQVTTNGTLTTLVSFNGANGASPFAGLTLGSDGNFYGTTFYGGSNGQGTVFQVTTNGTLTTLVSFNGANGANPMSVLTLGSDGNFYGTTVEWRWNGVPSHHQWGFGHARLLQRCKRGESSCWADAGERRQFLWHDCVWR